MRQARHQRITSLYSNKENELANNSTLTTNLPSLRNNKKISFKNDYHINLNQRKKTFINLCMKKQNQCKNNINKIAQPTKRAMETARLLSDQTLPTHSSGIYLSSRGEKRTFNNVQNKNCIQKYHILQKHQINIKMRAKMIDWLIQISQAYKCKNQTLFLAIHLMDQYFLLSQKCLPISQLHLIGVTCIYMASKYEQIHCIRMKALVRDIAHGKIAASQIIQKQSQILIALSFRFDRKCPFMISQQIKNQIRQAIPKSQFESLSQNLLYYLKLIAFDCDLLTKQNSEHLAKGAILASIRSMPQISKNLQLYESFINNCGEDYQSSHHICSQIMFIHINFKSQFGSLENIQKQCPFKTQQKYDKSSNKIIQSCSL